MQAITWGLNTESANSKKRKHEDDSECVYNKKSKRYELYNPMIYSCGTEIHYTCVIDKISIELLIKEFTKIINDNTDTLVNDTLEIRYIVDSPGGCVSSVLKFVDYIAMIKKKYPNLILISIASGQIASAATIMCIIADKRQMTNNATAMIHELATGRSGVYSHLQSYSKHLKSLHDTLTNIYIAKTGHDKQKTEAMLLKETWFTASEYLAENFVDEII